MSDTQLYLAIGIPSLLVILNIIQSNRLADKIDRLAEQQHKDALTLQGYMIPLHERMAVLETKRK